MEPEPSPQAPPPATVPQEGAAASSRGKRRRRHYDTATNFRRGRLWIAAIFCALRLLDALVAIIANLLPEGSDRRYLYLYIFLTGIWSTALLVAVWLRHAWARYVLVGLLALTPVGEIYLLPKLEVDFGGATVDPVLVGSSIMYAGVAALLILVKPIRRLTSQSYT